MKGCTGTGYEAELIFDAAKRETSYESYHGNSKETVANLLFAKLVENFKITVELEAKFFFPFSFL